MANDIIHPAPAEYRDDERWMEEALRLAHQAQLAGEVPVGAVVVRHNQIIGRGSNHVIGTSDPTAHAEILAMRDAARAIDNYRLVNCQLFTTLEPCAMCAGAIMQARVARLIFGADDQKSGAAGGVLEIINHPRLNHQMEITSGVLGARCMDILQEFFRARR